MSPRSTRTFAQSQHGDAKVIVLAGIGVAVLGIVGVVAFLRWRAYAPAPAVPQAPSAAQSTGQVQKGNPPAPGEPNNVAPDAWMKAIKPAAIDTSKDAKIAPMEPVPATITDTDRDGLSDDAEKRLGTDPKNPDTDGDGLLDGDEVRAGTDPKTKTIVQPKPTTAPQSPATAKP